MSKFNVIIITTVIIFIEIRKSGHLIVLTCNSFFNEFLFVFLRDGGMHGRTSFLILYNASMKRNGQLATTYTLLYTHTDIFRWKSKY